jgi:hypothetical protein
MDAAQRRHDAILHHASSTNDGRVWPDSSTVWCGGQSVTVRPNSWGIRTPGAGGARRVRRRVLGRVGAGGLRG